jgi:hypothetical protein
MTQCGMKCSSEFFMKMPSVLLLSISGLFVMNVALGAEQSPNDFLGMWQMDVQNSSESCLSGSLTTPEMNVTVEGDSLTATFSAESTNQSRGLGTGQISFSVSANALSMDDSGTLRYGGQWFDGKSATNCVFKRVNPDQSSRQETAAPVCGSFPFFHSCDVQ